MTEEKSKSKQHNVLWLVLPLAGAWFFFGGGWGKLADSSISGVYSKVAADAVDRYELSKRSGTPIDVCVQAGFVAAAYLQAKDEGNYSTWKNTEKLDCIKAGIRK